MCILITRPRHDDTTEYLFAWTKPIINFAERKGIKVLNLKGKKANRDTVESFLKSKNPRVVFFNGHGNDYTIFGHNNEIIIQSNRNEGLLKDKITYARVCQAGKKLGKDIIKSGDGTFIGYKKPFSFFIDERWSANPLKDKTAALFLKPSNEIIASLIKGNTVKGAVEKSIRLTIKEIKRYSTMTEPGSQQIAWLLFENLEGLVILGKKNARL